MFDFLADKLQSAFKSLTGKGILTEADVDAALRDLRLALLEADVALPAIKHLIAHVREQAVGQKVLGGVNPGQQVVKIVYDGLIELLGSQQEPELGVAPPAVILMCGLQGSGKTTSSAKLAAWLAKQGKRPYLASLDTHRPAAIEQLATLAKGLELPALESESKKPIERAKQALAAAKKALADVLILDTAGRLDVAPDLLDELAEIHKLSKPAATLLVADAQMGQSAVGVAEAFKTTVPLTGLILTRLDGDARGGAALSLRFITGVPIMFVGTGEATDKFEPFRPDGLASRILGQGDVVALVEKMQGAVDETETARLEQKLISGAQMDFTDIKKQLNMMRKMGGMAAMLELMPGMGALRGKIPGEALDKKALSRQIAIIDSMTPTERANPKLLNAKRRLRIAAGSGTTVQDVNKLAKMQEQLNQMTKMLRGGGLNNLKNMLRR
ncbi:MAG TPA: signal recognition particle protein [Alphaproteobacteria bacterium]|nr:signal recognition particle protein [Alphaproteobacteria bacterium]